MKHKPDINLADIFDDVEDECRVQKNSHPFIPYEDCGASNLFNPEEMFILKEEKQLNNNDDEEQSFIIKSPRQVIEPCYLPITLDIEEPLLELIPCNAKLKINEPHRLGIGKSTQLKKLHHGHR